MEKENNEGRTLCEIYSRVCGWLTARSQFNKGKLAERNDLKTYNIPDKNNLKTND